MIQLRFNKINFNNVKRALDHMNLKVDIQPKWKAVEREKDENDYEIENNTNLPVDQDHNQSINSHFQETTEVYSIRLSMDSAYVAAALGDGHVVLHSTTTGRLSYLLTKFHYGSASAIRFNPKNRKTFISASSGGMLNEWTIKTPKIVWQSEEPENQIYGLDINYNGTKLSTAGTDKIVRIYDEETKRLFLSLSRRPYDQTSPYGHSDRIYCTQFDYDNNDILYTGGWDNSVQQWDLRVGAAVTVYPGPHVCGDSIDISGNLLLACSWRTHDQIQIFDKRNSKILKKTSWSSSDGFQAEVYTAKFLPDKKTFYAGGSYANSLRFFETESCIPVASPLSFDSAVFAAATTQNGDAIIVGTAGGGLFYHSIKY